MPEHDETGVPRPMTDGDFARRLMSDETGAAVCSACGDLPHHLTATIDGYEAQPDTDEADDLVYRAGVDEFGWLCIEVDNGRELRFRPSEVLAVLAKGMR